MKVILSGSLVRVFVFFLMILSQTGYADRKLPRRPGVILDDTENHARVTMTCDGCGVLDAKGNSKEEILFSIKIEKELTLELIEHRVDWNTMEMELLKEGRTAHEIELLLETLCYSWKVEWKNENQDNSAIWKVMKAAIRIAKRRYKDETLRKEDQDRVTNILKKKEEADRRRFEGHFNRPRSVPPPTNHEK